MQDRSGAKRFVCMKWGFSDHLGKREQTGAGTAECLDLPTHCHAWCYGILHTKLYSRERGSQFGDSLNDCTGDTFLDLF